MQNGFYYFYTFNDKINKSNFVLFLYFFLNSMRQTMTPF